MKKILFFVLFAVFVICGPAYCHTFEATGVSKDGSEALLRDRVTGDEWVVHVGDQIGEYRVIKITMDYVTIVHPGENGALYLTDIPNLEKHTIRVSP